MHFDCICAPSTLPSLPSSLPSDFMVFVCMYVSQCLIRFTCRSRGQGLFIGTWAPYWCLLMSQQLLTAYMSSGRDGAFWVPPHQSVIVFILAPSCPHLRRKIIESTYSLFLLGQTFSASKTSHWDDYSNLKAKALPKGRVKNEAVESFGLGPAWWLTLAIQHLRSRGKNFQTSSKPTWAT